MQYSYAIEIYLFVIISIAITAHLKLCGTTLECMTNQDRSSSKELPESFIFILKLLLLSRYYSQLECPLNAQTYNFTVSVLKVYARYSKQRQLLLLLLTHGLPCIICVTHSAVYGMSLSARHEVWLYTLIFFQCAS